VARKAKSYKWHRTKTGAQWRYHVAKKGANKGKRIKVYKAKK